MTSWETQVHLYPVGLLGASCPRCRAVPPGYGLSPQGRRRSRRPSRGRSCGALVTRRISSRSSPSLAGSPLEAAAVTDPWTPGSQSQQEHHEHSCAQQPPPQQDALPHASPFGIFGPVPTSCKNLYPENKQLGNASSCIPGLGPRRQRAPITQQPPRAGRERGYSKGMWDAEPSRENSILLPVPALSNQRTSAQTKAACAGAAPRRCHSPCLLQDFRALPDVLGGGDPSVPSRLTCSMGGRSRPCISALYSRISYTFGTKYLSESVTLDSTALSLYPSDLSAPLKTRVTENPGGCYIPRADTPNCGRAPQLPLQSSARATGQVTQNS
ncbi:uncharacterized protein LOC121676368 [Corvus kubaryi]|uniref:uncharacterized protein LOC121676368 n=1 Tax=Corvus kubaryi TaxID=68294 RepID=UPI001C03DD31|nr:uncharacterized protein LOC121676368 [Corvus kubaryi]